MSQQEEDPSRYTCTLVVKPALSQMYDQVEVPRNGMQELLHSRPVTCVYLDLGISQTVKVLHMAVLKHKTFKFFPCILVK